MIMSEEIPGHQDSPWSPESLDKSIFDGPIDPRERSAGIVFSIVVGLIPAFIAVVTSIAINENISAPSVGWVGLGALIISSFVIWLLRTHVKGFTRIFSYSFMTIFALGVVYVYIMFGLSASLCHKLGGDFLKNRPYSRRSLDRTCFVSRDVYERVMMNSSFVSSQTTFKVR